MDAVGKVLFSQNPFCQKRPGVCEGMYSGLRREGGQKGGIAEPIAPGLRTLPVTGGVFGWGDELMIGTPRLRDRDLTIITHHCKSAEIRN